MRNFKDIIIEKLRVTKNVSTKPELVDRNIVSCTMEFFFKWIMVVDHNRDLTQADFEDFEVLEDDYLKRTFKTYENLFNWYEDNKDETIEVTVTRSLEEYRNVFLYDEIEFKFYSGGNLINAVKLMKNLKDILLEKLKVSKNTNILSFTFDDLCKSILQFVNKNASNSSIVYRFNTEHVIKISNLDYFKDNPLIIQDDTSIKWIDRFIKGCKVGMMLLNTNNPQCIVGYTTDRSITLNDSNALDKSFDITEKNFTQIFNIDDLEKLYDILNEDI